jgi:hypothetical protein
MIALVLFLALTPGILALVQYPPSALAFASGVYDSSETPPTLPWNTYNFCNAPHVNAAHYELPPNATATGGQLVHVSVVMRHHKVRNTQSRLPPPALAHDPPAHTRQPRALRTRAQSTHRLDLRRRAPAHVRSRRRSDRARLLDAP